MTSVCQGCKKVRSSPIDDSMQPPHADQQPKDWLSAIRGFGAVVVGVILGAQLIGSEPLLLTLRSSQEPILLTSWQLALLGLATVAASAVAAADIFASDLRSKGMPSFTRSKSWRRVVRLIWLTVALLLIAFIVTQATVAPVSR